MNSSTIPYSIKISKRARRMRLAVYCDASVVVTVPLGFSLFKADEFIRNKLAWIEKSLEYFRPFKNRVIIKSGKRDYARNKKQALELAKSKIEQWNKIYGFAYNRINIKNQKTRWGSCSKKGNLHFNYKIVRLPTRLVDYLVVHELCHLKEFNHSKNFWELVAQVMPDYRALRKELRNFHFNSHSREGGNPEPALSLDSGYFAPQNSGMT